MATYTLTDGTRKTQLTINGDTTVVFPTKLDYFGVRSLDGANILVSKIKAPTTLEDGVYSTDEGDGDVVVDDGIFTDTLYLKGSGTVVVYGGAKPGHLPFKKSGKGGDSEGSLRMLGATTTALTDGATTNPITIDGESVTAVKNDVAIYNTREFYFSGTTWSEFGGAMDTTPTSGSANAVTSDGIYKNTAGKREYVSDVEKGEIFNTYSGTYKNVASGEGSHAEGYGSQACNSYSHAENQGKAYGYNSHAEGGGITGIKTTDPDAGTVTYTKGNYAHAEGGGVAEAGYSHAEGKGTHTYIGNGYSDGSTAAHAEGINTSAFSAGSHAEGRASISNHDACHAEGENTTAGTRTLNPNTGRYTYGGKAAHAEGSYTAALGKFSHAEGNYTTASGEASHSEGYKTIASGKNSHAEGGRTETSGDTNGPVASGDYSHAEGCKTTASGNSAHAEGSQTTASGDYSHAEGGPGTMLSAPTASGINSHAEGCATTSSGEYSHAEGCKTTASGNYSHAEGGTDFIGGAITEARGYSSHAEGTGTLALGDASHAEGVNTQAIAPVSHAGGRGTRAVQDSMTAIGKYNAPQAGSLFEVGNGTADDDRSNIVEVNSTRLNVNGDIEQNGVPIRATTMPTITASMRGKVVQYVGASTNTYKKGCFYECVSEGSTYIWKPLTQSSYSETVLWENDGTTNPATITLSSAYTDFDALILWGISISGTKWYFRPFTIQTSLITAAETAQAASVIGTYSDSGGVWYGVTSTTELTYDAAAGGIVLQRIVGVNY